MATWYSVIDPAETDRLVLAWPDAPIENEELCASILDTARDQVLAFAPASPLEADWTTTPPTNLVLAQLRQAENLWNAGRVSSSGEIGVDQYTFTPRPMDKTIRQIIRPQDMKPHVL